MKKLFVVADVHSFYNEMIDALAEKGFDKNDPDHVFVSLGDLFDRGRHVDQRLNHSIAAPIPSSAWCSWIPFPPSARS